MRLAPVNALSTRGPRRLTARRLIPICLRSSPSAGAVSPARRHGALALRPPTVHVAIYRQRGMQPSRANRCACWLDFSHTNAAQAQPFRDIGASAVIERPSRRQPLFRLSMFRIKMRLPARMPYLLAFQAAGRRISQVDPPLRRRRLGSHTIPGGRGHTHH